MASKLNLNGKTVYILGVDYSVKEEIPWTDAVTGILKGKMTPFLVHPTKRLRSAGGSVDMAHPLMVRLNYWRPVPRLRPMDPHSRASRAQILRRDARTCCYCGDPATTVDHVKPESRCKRDGDSFSGWTWSNLVACCFSCNQKKRDKTPEEAGMKLLWDPHLGGDKYAHVQAEVWRILEQGDGYVEEAILYEGLLS